MQAFRGLVVVERAYRGSVEAQYCDVLYFLRELNRQLERLDLALRGLAVTYALDVPGAPPAQLGFRALETVPHPRQAVASLVSEGSNVTADLGDLTALGFAAHDLLDGVSCADTSSLTETWDSYDGVWFM